MSEFASTALKSEPAKQLPALAGIAKEVGTQVAKRRTDVKANHCCQEKEDGSPITVADTAADKSIKEYWASEFPKRLKLMRF